MEGFYQEIYAGTHFEFLAGAFSYANNLLAAGAQAVAVILELTGTYNCASIVDELLIAYTLTGSTWSDWQQYLLSDLDVNSAILLVTFAVDSGGQVKQRGKYSELLESGTAVEKLVSAHLSSITALDTASHKLLNSSVAKIQLGRR